MTLLTSSLWCLFIMLHFAVEFPAKQFYGGELLPPERHLVSHRSKRPKKGEQFKRFVEINDLTFANDECITLLDLYFVEPLIKIQGWAKLDITIEAIFFVSSDIEIFFYIRPKICINFQIEDTYIELKDVVDKLWFPTWWIIFGCRPYKCSLSYNWWFEATVETKVTFKSQKSMFSSPILIIADSIHVFFL